jgi:hypothetical protein
MADKRKFEAHITCPREASSVVESVAGEQWKFSAIDGDPVMGKKAYCYLTGFANDSGDLLLRMQQKAGEIEDKGIEVLRLKVEEIIYDTKTGVDCLKEQCCGHCGEP